MINRKEAKKNVEKLVEIMKGHEMITYEGLKKNIEKLAEIISKLSDVEYLEEILLGVNVLPEPELKVGMWVRHRDSKIIQRITNINAENYCDTIGINGIELGSIIFMFKPHVFVEKDLELLNTDDVTYRLVDEGERLYIDGHAENGVDKGHIVFTTQTFKTAHEAIAEVFTQTTAMNLLNSKIGDNNEC